MSILVTAIGDEAFTDDEEKEDRELSQTSMDGSFRGTTLRQTQYATKCVYQALERLACDASFNKAIWSIMSAPTLVKSQNRDQLSHTKSSQKCLKIHPLPWIRSSQSTSVPLSLAIFPPYPASTSPPSKRTNAGGQCTAVPATRQQSTACSKTISRTQFTR